MFHKHSDGVTKPVKAERASPPPSPSKESKAPPPASNLPGDAKG